jgi:hypothetical protein
VGVYVWGKPALDNFLSVSRWSHGYVNRYHKPSDSATTHLLVHPKIARVLGRITLGPERELDADFWILGGKKEPSKICVELTFPLITRCRLDTRNLARRVSRESRR